MTDLPPGFVLEKSLAPPAAKGPRPDIPPGFVLDGQTPAPQTAPAAADPGSRPGFLESALMGVDDLGRSLAKGLPFIGTGIDEFAAKASQLTGIGNQSDDAEASDYETLLAAERARDADISLWTEIPGQIVGGIAGTIAAAPVAAAAVPARVAAAAAALPGWLKASGLGAALSGAYAFGEGEGGGRKRTEAAIEGAAIGAVAGPAIQGAVKGGGAGARAVSRVVRQRFSPQSAAVAKVAQNIARDEMTPARVRQRLADLGPQATLADAGGRNLRSAARDISGLPGPAGNRAEIVLNQRAEAEGERLAKVFAKTLDPREYYAAKDAFIDNMRTKASPLYVQAYEEHQSLMSPRLKALVDHEFGRKALLETATLVSGERAAGVSKYLGAVDEELTAAAREAADVGKMAPVGRPGVLRGFSLETWNEIKRGYDALLQRPEHRNELTGSLTKSGLVIDQMRRSMLKELDRLTGGETGLYAKARRIWAGEAEAIEALQDGRKAISIDPELVSRQLATLSEAGRDAYRAGFARALKDVVDKTPDMASAARRIFGNNRSRTRIRAAMPDAASYNALAKSLIAESRFAQTRAHVLSGSMTQPRQAGAADVTSKAIGSLGAIAGANLPGTHALVGSRIGREAANALIGGSQDAFSREMSRLLLNRNQATNQLTLDQIQRATLASGVGSELQRRLGLAAQLAGSQQIGGFTSR